LLLPQYGAALILFDLSAAQYELFWWRTRTRSVTVYNASYM